MNKINIKRKYVGKVDWDSARKEIQCFVGKFYYVDSLKAKIGIDQKFVKEYTGSQYTKNVDKTIKKIKVSLIDKLDIIISNAENVIHEENVECKHNNDAKCGWDKYKIYFSYNTTNERNENLVIDYSAVVVIRCPEKNKKYLYDIVDIKKEACNSQQM